MLLQKLFSRYFNRDAIRVNDYRKHDLKSVMEYLEYQIPDHSFISHNKLVPLEKTINPVHFFQLKRKSTGVCYYQIGLLYQRAKFLASVMIDPKQKWSEIRKYPTPFIMALDTESPLDKVQYIQSPVYFLKGLIMDENNIETNIIPKMYFFHPVYDLISFPVENIKRQLNFICEEMKVDSCTVLRYIHRMPTYLTYIDTKSTSNVGIASLPTVPYNMEIQKLKCNVFPPIMNRTIDISCFKIQPMYHRMILNNFDGISKKFTPTDISSNPAYHINLKFQDILYTNYAKSYKTYTPDDLFSILYPLYRQKQGQHVLDWKVRKRIRCKRLESRHIRDEITLRENKFYEQAEKARLYAIDNYICCPRHNV